MPDEQQPTSEPTTPETEPAAPAPEPEVLPEGEAPVKKTVKRAPAKKTAEKTAAKKTAPAKKTPSEPVVLQAASGADFTASDARAWLIEQDKIAADSKGRIAKNLLDEYAAAH